MAHTISIDAAATALNQFVARFSPQIQQSLRQGLELERELPFVTADYAYTGQDISLSALLQPYQSAFTPNNTESFDGITNYLRPIKVDLQFDAIQLEKFFSRWATNWFTPDPAQTQQGYAGYLINNHIVPQVLQDVNTVSWAGDYAAPTPGTAGPLLTAVDGFKKAITAQIAAGRLTPITSAPVTTDPLNVVRDFCEDIPEPYRYRTGKLFMSKTNAQKYSDAYKNEYKGNSAVIANADGLRLRVDDYNKTIVGITAMEGSDRVICVFDNLDSMIIGTRAGFPVYFQFRFEEEDRKLKVFSEIYRFYGFETCLHMFINDQE